MIAAPRKRQQFGRPSADRTYMFPRAARVFVAAELLFGVAYFLLPPSGLRGAAYSATSVGMVVAVVIGVRRWKPAQPMAWYLIAGGQLLSNLEALLIGAEGRYALSLGPLHVADLVVND